VNVFDDEGALVVELFDGLAVGGPFDILERGFGPLVVLLDVVFEI
jgi:hypothetical protein